MNYITEIKLFHDWLETHGEMTPAAVLLWYGLMFLTNKAGWRKGVALPMSRIEGVTLMTESRIYRARKILVEAGILEVEEKGSHRASVYTLIPFEEFRDLQSALHNDTHSDTQNEGQNETQIDGNAPRALQNEAENDTHFGSITKPRLNRDVRKNQKKKFSLEAWLEEVESPWNELMRMWLEYKKARNEAYTSEMGTKACLTKLKNLSGNSPQTAQAIIEQSMANNWAGLFPLSAQTSRGRPSGSGSLVPATGQRLGQILQPETEEHRNAILDKFKRKAAADMSHRPSEQKDNTND